MRNKVLGLKRIFAKVLEVRARSRPLARERKAPLHGRDPLRVVVDGHDPDAVQKVAEHATDALRRARPPASDIAPVKVRHAWLRAGLGRLVTA